MSRSSSGLIAGALILAVAAPGLADEWCSQFPNSIFCYDFDRSCSAPPPYPGTCTSGADPRVLRSVWDYNSWNSNTGGPCGSDMTIEEIDEILPSDPYGGRHANGGDESGDLGQNSVDLTPYIGVVAPGSTQINGTDEHPLVLTFTMGAYARGAMQFTNGYMELSLLEGEEDHWNPVSNPAKAPTDYVLAGADDGTGCKNCDASCPGADASVSVVSWPTICQQEFPTALCPPKQTLVRNTLAIGALALLDNNPCHCCTVEYVDPGKPWRKRCQERSLDFPDGWQEPTNVHLSYFDGLEWRVLKEGMGGPGSYGDFRYGNYVLCDPNADPPNLQCSNPAHVSEGYELVVLTIKSNTVDIYHKTKMVALVDNQPVETWVESLATDMPRRYPGAFNRLRAGTDESCRLRNDSYTCDPTWKNGKRLCRRMKEERCDPVGGNATYRASYVSFDNVRLDAGVIPPVPGACCLPNASCTQVLEAECTSQEGVFQGQMTTCEALPRPCCPRLYPDSDRDGDVDQLDFAALQRCLTGDAVGVTLECKCLDKNRDERINEADVLNFVNCATGPGAVTTPVAPDCAP